MTLSILRTRLQPAVAAVGLAGVVATVAWIGRDREVPATGVVRIVPSVAEPQAQPLPSTPVHATTLLDPPRAPVIADAVAAPPDAFAGRWADGTAHLAITRSGAERYDVRLTRDGTEEVYDGIVRDGRIHIERGIDGDWIQASGSSGGCLYLGTGERFCRAG